MPANFPWVSLAMNKSLLSPELGLSYCRTKQKAGWGGQQVLFLKHIWESSIKRRRGQGGGKVHQNHEKVAFTLQVRSPCPALYLDEKHFQRVPQQHHTLQLTAVESANAQTQNLVHFGIRIQHLHPAPGGSLLSLCQYNLLLVKYNQVSDLSA